MTRYPLTRDTGTPRKPRGFVYFDLETEGLGGRFLDAASLADDEDEPTRYASVAHLVDAMLDPHARGKVWLAHNGGEYDDKYLLPELRDRLPDGLTASLNLQGERCIGLTIRQGNRTVQVLDSFALVPVSLDQFTAAYAPEVRKFDIGLSRGVIYDPTNPEHYAYLCRDLAGLKAAHAAFVGSVHEHFGVYPRRTTPATALAAWRRTLPEEFRAWRLRPEVESFCRDAYYGGLVFLRRTTKVRGVVGIDVNSMYPSVMERCGVPVGSPAYTRHEVPGAPAFYRCRVRVPPTLGQSPLPLRPERAVGICWPVGEFETTITSVEVDYARRVGVAARVIEGYVFPRVEHLFDDFVSTCKALRHAYPRTSPQHQTAKLMQNSLYGKFGAREHVTAYRLAIEPESRETPAIDPRTGMPVPDTWVSSEELDEPYMQPHWAAWITANARVHLLDADRRLGFRAIAADTDSLYVDYQTFREARARGDLDLDDDRYGAFKVEETFAWFRAIAPKTYIGRRPDGTYKLRAKGVSRREQTPRDLMRAVHEKTTVSYDSTHSTRVLFTKPGAPIAVRRVRSYSQIANAAGWWADPAGNVWPVLARDGTLSRGWSLTDSQEERILVVLGSDVESRRGAAD